MKATHTTATGPAVTVRIGDLEPVGTAMTEEELQVASGAMQPQWPVSWTSGNPAKADEWEKP